MYLAGDRCRTTQITEFDKGDQIFWRGEKLDGRQIFGSDTWKSCLNFQIDTKSTLKLYTEEDDKYCVGDTIEIHTCFKTFHVGFEQISDRYRSKIDNGEFFYINERGEHNIVQTNSHREKL